METITKLMARVLRVSESRITDDLHMRDIAEWDSLKHMELIVAIEQNYRIELTGDEIADMVSLEAIKQILKQRGV
ncbi:MAG: acyl carrier protein [Rickettsiales bacterium]|jgi:acyl carrier protein|nr:acyl carrier protein [Rickettsiales bacterium]